MKTKEINQPGGKPFLLVQDKEPLDVFVDGAINMSVGPSVSKLIFFRVTETDQEKKMDIREPALRLTLPTPALFELASFVLQQGQENRDKILDNAAKQYEAFRTALQQLKIEQGEKGERVP